jgi:hypothetical protein
VPILYLPLSLVTLSRGAFRDVDVCVYLRKSVDVPEAFAYAEELSARLS